MTREAWTGDWGELSVCQVLGSIFRRSELEEMEVSDVGSFLSVREIINEEQ